VTPGGTRNDSGNRAAIAALRVTVKHALKLIPILGPSLEFGFELIEAVAAELGVSPKKVLEWLRYLPPAETNKVVDSELNSPEGRTETAGLTAEQKRLLRRRLMGIPTDAIDIMARIEEREVKARRDAEEAKANAARQEAAEAQAEADAEYPRLEASLKRLMEAGSWYSAFEVLEQMEIYRPGGYDLRLMTPVNDVSGIPIKGKSLIILAAVNNVLHFRKFDGDGEMVVDTDEKRLTRQVRQIEDLRDQLESLWPPRVLTRSEKSRVITVVTSIVDHIRPTGVPHREYRHFIETRITKMPLSVGSAGCLTMVCLLPVAVWLQILWSIASSFGSPPFELPGQLVLIYLFVFCPLVGWLGLRLIWPVLPKFTRRALMRLAIAVNRKIGLGSRLRDG
jgi:hypothetical protein